MGRYWEGGGGFKQETQMGNFRYGEMERNERTAKTTKTMATTTTWVGAGLERI